MKFLFRTARTACDHLLSRSKFSNVIYQNVLYTRFCSKVNAENIQSKDAESQATKEELTKQEVDGLKGLLENAASFDQTNPPDDQWTTPVYPIDDVKRSQARHSIRPQTDPRSTSVVLFPGQGTQYVGMAKSLLDYENVSDMFGCASEIVRYDLLDLCLHGPKQMLDDTVHCQVALLVTSLAAVEKLRVSSPEAIENCVATAGFSVGEYAALVFAGALNFEDAVRLLKIRGEAMQAASDLIPSGMMTVMFKPEAKPLYMCTAAREWCIRQNIDNPECCVAIYLYPECKVIAGNFEALKFLEMNATDFGIKKIKYLPVSGAFHSKLMKPAKQVLDRALNSIRFEDPLIPVHANVDSKPYANIKQLEKKLSEQLCNPVKWEQTMHVIFERPKDTPFPTVYECGPGTSLKSVLRMNNFKAHSSCKNVLLETKEN